MLKTNLKHTGIKLILTGMVLFVGIALFACNKDKEVKNYCVSKTDSTAVLARVNQSTEYSYQFMDFCQASIAVMISSSYTAAITIYNEEDELVWSSTQSNTLSLDMYGNPQPTYLTWNHRNKDGDMVDEGTYTWEVTYKYEGRSVNKTYTENWLCPPERVTCP